jgi:hypothetical protein
LSREQARLLAQEALNLPLEALGRQRAEEALERLRAERQALKRDLIRAYGVLPEAFQGLDQLELLGQELLAITLLAPGGRP